MFHTFVTQGARGQSGSPGPPGTAGKRVSEYLLKKTHGCLSNVQDIVVVVVVVIREFQMMIGVRVRDWKRVRLSNFKPVTLQEPSLFPCCWSVEVKASGTILVCYEMFLSMCSRFEKSYYSYSISWLYSETLLSSPSFSVVAVFWTTRIQNCSW